MPKLSRSKSSVISDITNNHVSPLAASSPRTSCNLQSLVDVADTLEAIEECAETLKKKYSEELNRLFEIRKCNLYEGMHALFKLGDFSKPATLEDITILMKLNPKTSSTTSKNNSKRKKTCSIVPAMNSLGIIPEEEDRKGKVKQTKVNADDSDDSIFKKPTDRGKRTLKKSTKTSFNTPQNNRGRRHGYNVAMVTPGPNFQKPVNILRRPNPGEMAISMTGSPLLIAHNNLPTHVPQISIPLADGRVMTVLANEALDPDTSICSEIDSETYERLAVLQELLSKKTKKNK